MQAASSPQFSLQLNRFELPPRSLADIYVDRYFSEVNDLICVLSYNEFRSWYHYAYPDKPLDQVKQAILYTVFAFGSKDDMNGAGEAFFSQALPSAGAVVARGGLEAIQTLILMVYP
jgi:hypothetical protein